MGNKKGNKKSSKKDDTKVVKPVPDNKKDKPSVTDQTKVVKPLKEKKPNTLKVTDETRPIKTLQDTPQTSSVSDKTKVMKTVQGFSSDLEQTKVMKTVEEPTQKFENVEETKKMKKEKKKAKKANNKKKHRALKIIIKIIIALVVIACIIGAGVFAGLFFGLFGDEFKISVSDLNINMENSVLMDLNGNVLATLNGEENREVILLSEMGEYLPKAFIAIEDKRFYEHSGVDISRTASATIKYLLKQSTHGGSTITQQLIKNATGEDDRTSMRKVKEIAKAFQIEREMSKQQILESYLNTIPLGGGAKNVYGVQVAANYYFNKQPAELTLAQCAYIAGINHSPNLYNPFKETPNTEKINNRTKTVLNEMKDQGKINQEQYDTAVAEVNAGLAFQEGNITSYNSLTQHEEEALKQVARQYAEEHDLKYDVALQRVQSSGYKIYITENKDIQNILDETYTSNTDWIKTKTITETDENGEKVKKEIELQSGMAVIDHKTGYVVAVRGVIGKKTPWGTNRATSATHQPGSSIKPIAVITPSIQEGLINAGTVVDDTPIKVGSYAPRNSGGGYTGLMNIRSILRVSRNIPEVKMMQKLTPAKSMEYLKQMGISTLSEGDEGLALALGGVGNGVSPLEMAGAYATIANKGVYQEPTFYTRVEDSHGNVVMEKHQEKHRVLSEENAWIVQSLLTEPTGTGLTGATGATGTRARVTNMQTCGKTGTTNDTTATWFCGFTPYYAAAMNFGFDKAKEGNSRYVPGSGTVAGRWGGIMNQIHKDLPAAKFEKPSGIVTARICRDSGLLVGENCEHDPRGSRIYTEYFVKGTTPKDACTTHVKLRICKETGKIANEFCADVEERVYITRPNSTENTSWQSASDAQYMAPTETCTTHTKKPDTEKPVITIKDVKDVIELTLNAKFTIPQATATDNIDGDISKNIKVEIKKDGKVVDKIDTSKAGVYTITYSVEDAAKNKATKTITVKVATKDNKPNGGTGNNSNTNTVTNTTR